MNLIFVHRITMLMYKDLLILIADSINDRETFYNFSCCNKMCQDIAKKIYIKKKLKYDHPGLLHGNALIGLFSCKYVPNDDGCFYLLNADDNGLMKLLPRYDGYNNKFWKSNNLNKDKASNTLLIDHISIISKYKK